MIQATDLRIGNYYDHNGEFRKATPDTILEVWKAERTWCNPIPLTEEILLKCGARRIDKYTFVLLGLFIHMRKIGFVFNVGKKKIVIEHLHQLQNWSHALTNTELNITL